jgi:DnaJ-class molecular chaperone
MNPVTKPCERCGGVGRTPRLRRKRADGSLDPLDIVGQHMEICDRCAGSGEVLSDPPPAVARHSGFVADLA